MQSSFFATIPAQLLYETAVVYRTRVALESRWYPASHRLSYLLGDNNTPNVWTRSSAHQGLVCRLWSTPQTRLVNPVVHDTHSANHTSQKCTHSIPTIPPTSLQSKPFFAISSQLLYETAGEYRTRGTKKATSSTVTQMPHDSCKDITNNIKPEHTQFL